MDKSLNEGVIYDIIQTKWLDDGRVGIVVVDRNTPGKHWSAYIGSRQTDDAGVKLLPEESAQLIAFDGTKLCEEEARPFFPWLNDRPYWH